MERSCRIVWADLKRRLEKRLGPKRFKLWLSSSRLLKLEGDRVVIGLPSSLHVDMARHHFTEEVAEVLKGCLGWRPDVRFVVDKSLYKRQRETEESFRRETAVDWSTEYSLPLDETFSLDHYAVGDANRTAYEKVEALLATGRPRLIYISGPRGVGKTHLAVGSGLLFRRDHSSKVTYTTPSAFQNALFEAIRRQEQPLFRKTMRECDLFILDEVETLPGHGRIHDEVIHTLDHLDLREARVVLAGRRPPAQLALPYRLRNRLQRGPLLFLDHPDKVLRCEIVRSLFKRHKEASSLICDDVAETLAVRFRCVETLVEAARQVVATAITRLTCGGGPINSEQLSSLSLRCENEPTSLATALAEAFAQRFGVAMEDIFSSTRKRSVSRARRLCVLALKRFLPDLSLTQIGAIFSVTHAAVHQMIIKAESMLKEDESLAEFYEETLRRFSS